MTKNNNTNETSIV